MVMNDVYCDGGFSVEYSLGKNNDCRTCKLQFGQSSVFTKTHQNDSDISDGPESN